MKPGDSYEIRWSGLARRALERLLEKVATAAVEFIYGALAENPPRAGRPLGFELEGSTAPIVVTGFWIGSMTTGGRSMF